MQTLKNKGNFPSDPANSGRSGVNESGTVQQIDTQLTRAGSPFVLDEAFREIIAKIADLTEFDPDDRNIQWIEGYSQACGDIILIVTRMARETRAKKS